MRNLGAGSPSNVFPYAGLFTDIDPLNTFVVVKYSDVQTFMDWLFTRCDTDWKRRYVHLAMRRQRNIAKMAMALAQNPRPPQWAAANGDHLWGAAEVELDARLSFLYSALAWRSTGMFESASLQVAKKSS